MTDTTNSDITGAGSAAGRPLALVTGASSGIGLELAKQFAINGYDLVLCAEDEGLEAAATQIGGAEITNVRADLATTAGVEALHAAVRAVGRPLAAAALNAGVGRGGAFLEVPIEDDFAIIDLNVRGTVHLGKLVLRDMADKGEGKVLITSSIASTMPGSSMSVYNASKSFLQSWVEALQDELKDSGVTLTSLMPGPTDTNFFRRAQMLDSLMGRAKKDSPEQVAEQGFHALLKGEKTLVAGSLITKATGATTKVLPDRLKAAANRVGAKPRD